MPIGTGRARASVTRKRGNNVYHASTQNLLSSAKTVSGSQLVRKVAQHIADVMVGAVRIELDQLESL